MSDTTAPRPVHDSRGLTRRSFFGMAAGLAAAWPLAAELGAASKIPIAVQLYSVRGDCKANFDDALARVAAMGFKGVEFAGYYGYADRPLDLKKRLRTLKLKAAGTHIGLERLQGDALRQTIDFHKTIDCQYLIVPGNSAFTDPEKSKALADTFNALAATLKRVGLSCGYHNHTREFTRDGGKTYWDLFAERTTRDVILQQDCGWTFAAGFDPVEYIRKYPGRTKTVHFKPTVRKEDVGKKAILGQDAVDWRSVYEACAYRGGTRWIVVEQETYPDGKTAMQCTEESLAGLKRLLS